MSPTANEPQSDTYAPDGSHLKTHQAYWQDLEKRNPSDLANLTLGNPGPGQSLQFTFLDTPVRVDLKNHQLLQETEAGWIPRDDPLLELVTVVYFNQIKDIYPLGRAVVGLQDLKESHFFVGPHELRLQPVIDRFSHDLSGFRRTATRLGGQLQDMADAAVRLWPFPRIPLYYLLWQGDDEFPPRVRVLFDRSIDDCLPADAIWALVNRVAQALAEG